MFPSAYLPLLVAGCGCLRLEVLGAHPQEIGPGASCLARIQNDRGDTTATCGGSPPSYA
jgi:hypothetical protein